jgi:large subunit ribosomal protein L22
MPYNYACQNYSKEHMARAVARSVPISTKASIEICNSIRHKSVARAKTILKDAISLRKPIRYTRFREGAGHKPGMAAGKFPKKASEHILQLIEAVEANAQFKGINTSNLEIVHIAAQDAGNVWRYGRQRRRKMKSTTIEIMVAEGKKEEKHEKKQAKAAEEKK